MKKIKEKINYSSLNEEYNQMDDDAGPFDYEVIISDEGMFERFSPADEIFPLDLIKNTMENMMRENIPPEYLAVCSDGDFKPTSHDDNGNMVLLADPASNFTPLYVPPEPFSSQDYKDYERLKREFEEKEKEFEEKEKEFEKWMEWTTHDIQSNDICPVCWGSFSDKWWAGVNVCLNCRTHQIFSYTDKKYLYVEEKEYLNRRDISQYNEVQNIETLVKIRDIYFKNTNRQDFYHENRFNPIETSLFLEKIYKIKSLEDWDKEIDPKIFFGRRYYKGRQDDLNTPRKIFDDLFNEDRVKTPQGLEIML